MSTRINVRNDYDAFLRAKLTAGVRYDGDYAVVPDRDPIHDHDDATTHRVAPHLHEYQRFALAFAISAKRAALFMECGLGKTSTALAWAQISRGDRPALVCAPLAAVHEWENEAARFYPDILIRFVKSADLDGWLDGDQDGADIIVCTHHAMIRPRDLSGIGALVLDESSILKSSHGKIAVGLKDSCAGMTRLLALSATPAPNDPTEYATHATWLGYTRTDAEFRARFFVRLTGAGSTHKWRLKGHARKAFPRWLSRWAVWMKDPAAYGMPCDALPPEHPGAEIVDVPSPGTELDRDLLGMPITMDMSTRARLRKDLYASHRRMEETVRLASSGRSIVWCLHNAHADACEKAIREAGIRVAQIAGVTPDEDRVEVVRAFQAGEVDCIVSKAKCIGHGVNLQAADVHVFAAYDESYEAHHQALRRSHRQGRRGNLRAYFLAAPEERETITTIRRKGADWSRLAEDLQREVKESLTAEIQSFQDGREISIMNEDRIERLPTVETEHYIMQHGDCIQVMAEMEPDSVDLAIFSPPFSSLFTYSKAMEDLGNASDGGQEFALHFAHFCDALYRVMKPGRVIAVHLQQAVSFGTVHGRQGLRDFRGGIIGAIEDVGFHYWGEFVISKNPQTQAIRSKTSRLTFAQFRRDSLGSSPTLNDFVFEFKKPGDSPAPVKNDVSEEEWIKWASGVWGDIRETDVLQGWQGGRGVDDEKHICPLQLEVIRRIVRLWSNHGDVVFDPFAGIGSVPWVAIEQGRIGSGIELKNEYFGQAVDNLDASVARHHMQGRLAL